MVFVDTMAWHSECTQDAPEPYDRIDAALSTNPFYIRPAREWDWKRPRDE